MCSSSNRRVLCGELLRSQIQVVKFISADDATYNQEGVYGALRKVIVIRFAMLESVVRV